MLIRLCCEASLQTYLSPALSSSRFEALIFSLLFLEALDVALRRVSKSPRGSTFRVNTVVFGR